MPVQLWPALLAKQPFTDVTIEAGVVHQFQVFEGTFGGGATVFDINNDGYEDLVITYRYRGPRKMRST